MKQYYVKIIYFLSLIAILAITVSAQQNTDKKEMPCPTMDKSDDPASSDMKMGLSKHSGHHDMVMKNGEKEMGFSQTATTHHFLIMKDGGAIQVEANDAKDAGNRDKIRMHLTEIAKEFQNGIFTTPFAVHGQVPPGVPVMNELKDKIKYTYEETEKGARVRISTNDPQALSAIHDFLRFQIEEHQTGDQAN